MIYVFEVEVKPGYTADQYAAAWGDASRIIQRSKGARGTRLHQHLDDANRLIAIASWDSRVDRDQSAANLDDTVRSIIESQAPFVNIRVVGEFDDAAWIVDPGDA